MIHRSRSSKLYIYHILGLFTNVSVNRPGSSPDAHSKTYAVGIYLYDQYRSICLRSQQ